MPRLKRAQWRTGFLDPQNNHEGYIKDILQAMPQGTIIMIKYPDGDEDIYTLTKEESDEQG